MESAVLCLPSTASPIFQAGKLRSAADKAEPLALAVSPHTDPELSPPPGSTFTQPPNPSLPAPIPAQAAFPTAGSSAVIVLLSASRQVIPGLAPAELVTDLIKSESSPWRINTGVCGINI